MQACLGEYENAMEDYRRASEAAAGFKILFGKYYFDRV